MPRAYKSKGKTTGLGFCAYISILFNSNEVNYHNENYKHILTDKQIALRLLEEFPGRKMALAFLDPNNRNTINDYRNKYNSGKFSPRNTPPLRHSFRYNENGERVDGRTGKNPLPVIQVLGLQSSNKYWKVRSMSSPGGKGHKWEKKDYDHRD